MIMQIRNYLYYANVDEHDQVDYWIKEKETRLAHGTPNATQCKTMFTYETTFQTYLLFSTNSVNKFEVEKPGSRLATMLDDNPSSRFNNRKHRKPHRSHVARRFNLDVVWIHDVIHMSYDNTPRRVNVIRRSTADELVRPLRCVHHVCDVGSVSRKS